MKSDPFIDGIRADLERQQKRAKALRAEYESRTPAERRSIRLVEYLCRHRPGCLLLEAWAWEGITAVRLSPFKQSPRRNEQKSVPAARARNTSDGDHRWNARYLALEYYLGSEASFDLRCDHLAEKIVTPEEVAEDVASAERAGTPTRRVFP